MRKIFLSPSLLGTRIDQREIRATKQSLRFEAQPQEIASSGFALLAMTILVGSLSSISCDRHCEVSGVVVNDSSRGPMKDISYDDTANHSSFTWRTDSSGEFKYEWIGWPGRGPVTLRFTKPGYQTVLKTCECGDYDTIHLVRQ